MNTASLARVLSRIHIEVGDIARHKASAIVNAANSSLLGGGGVDGAIHRAAGPGLLEECKKLGGCPTGEAKATKGYDLPAAWVVHAVGPVWQGGGANEAQLLANAYTNSLLAAAGLGARSLAFPAISTGAYGYPKEAAARIAVRSIVAFLTSHDCPSDVYCVCFSDESAEAHKRALDELGALSQ